MRIGRDNNFLAIERVDAGEPDCACRMEAVITGPGGCFSAVHGNIVVDTSEATTQQAEAFLEVTEHRLDLPLSEGGWLRMKRNSKGCIIVHYRLVRWEMWAAMEGEILVERESASDFCNELKALLCLGV